jgi:hypothetical protein
VKNIKQSYIHIGFTTILTLFVSICLIIFAALSILTSRSDLKLSQKYADRITHEYQANAVAQAFTKNIEDSIVLSYQHTTDPQGFQKLCRQNIENLPLPSTITDLQISDADNNALLIQFSTTIATHQQLNISLTVKHPEAGTDSFVSINSWNTSTDMQPETENSNLHLFKGKKN